MDFYSQAVPVALFSFIAFLLAIPTLIYQVRLRNVESSLLVTSLAGLNLIQGVNAIIWPDNDVEKRWNGNILCDIEVKLQFGLPLMIATSFFCIAKHLRDVIRINNDRAHEQQSKKIAPENPLVNIAHCFFVPAVFTALQYVVQTGRYGLIPVHGCIALYATWWPAFLTTLLPQWIYSMLAFYHGMGASRGLLKHRKHVRSVMANGQITASAQRLLRLAILTAFMMLLYLPLIFAVVVYKSVDLFQRARPYSWDQIHDWSKTPIIYLSMSPILRGCDALIIASGFVIFLIFGTTVEALSMYKGWIRRLANVPRSVLRR